ncbi:hypothetical protein V6N13_038536 [Hibiscus sabdariffa]|uniref:Ferritin n=1 Tax=Hibiscus sabdariffa TaxID=183260 RepID=A0ABR2S2E6_9ROSI
MLLKASPAFSLLKNPHVEVEHQVPLFSSLSCPNNRSIRMIVKPPSMNKSSGDLFLSDSNVEYNVSYVYHAMFAYFDRDNVALKSLAK